MDIRRLDRANLTRAYGIDSERLLPWSALNSPFEGAWCVVRPGEQSEAHAHHEYEIFIALTGRATLAVDDQRAGFVAGDIAHLRPGTTHWVVNDDTVDFEFYAVWWDTDLSTAFVARHERPGTQGAGT